jgi:hypothetical protein
LITIQQRTSLPRSFEKEIATSLLQTDLLPYLYQVIQDIITTIIIAKDTSSSEANT